MFEKLKARQLGKRAYVGLFVVTYLIFAFFLTWRDEHAEVLRLNEKLSSEKESQEILIKKGLPELRGVINRSPWLALDQVDPGSVVIIEMIISNTGAPTVVDQYKLLIATPDGHNIHVSNPTFYEKGFYFQGPERAQIIDPGLFLTEQTAQKQIVTNGRAVGVLFFKLGDYPPQAVARRGTLYTVSFKDVNQKEWFASFQMGDYKGEADIYIPGGQEGVHETTPSLKR